MAIPIIMCGAAGRMGRTILECAAQDPAFEIVAGVSRSTGVGGTVGDLLENPAIKAPVVGSLTDIEPSSDYILIDCSAPEATLTHLHWAAEREIPVVVGTTGLNAEQRAEMSAIAKIIPIVFAPSMSVGVETLARIVGDMARILGEGYDIEITEMHHRLKKDAPSGMAKRLGEVIAKAMGETYDKLAINGREGMTDERPSGQIGMHALRGGDIVGDHTVSFTTLGERIEITHRAHNRETFARGALRAAAWLGGKKPGLYDMQDVLGLK